MHHHQIHQDSLERIRLPANDASRSVISPVVVATFGAKIHCSGNQEPHRLFCGSEASRALPRELKDEAAMACSTKLDN